MQHSPGCLVGAEAKDSIQASEAIRGSPGKRHHLGTMPAAPHNCAGSRIRLAAGKQVLPSVSLCLVPTALRWIPPFSKNLIPPRMSFRPSSVLRQQLHSPTLRLFSRLEDER
jgi:hypothetical protein